MPGPNQRTAARSRIALVSGSVLAGSTLGMVVSVRFIVFPSGYWQTFLVGLQAEAESLALASVDTVPAQDAVHISDRPFSGRCVQLEVHGTVVLA